jgi:hypothetical protein
MDDPADLQLNSVTPSILTKSPGTRLSVLRSIVSLPRQTSPKPYRFRQNTTTTMTLRASQITFSSRGRLNAQQRQWHIQLVIANAPTWAVGADVVFVTLSTLIERQADVLKRYYASK